MSDKLHKFPKTPHLFWLGRTPARDDKVLTPGEAEAFLDGEVIVEEKVDGANLGISVEADGKVRFQNRGNYLEGKLTGQLASLRGWGARRLALLKELLPPGTVLFGEWCFARHSVHYTRLPDWFLGFDLLEEDREIFWSTARRDELLAALPLEKVRALDRGRFTRREILAFLDGKSAYADAPLEGVYLRREQDGKLVTRAKLVRPDFVQGIGAHWSKGQLTANTLRGAEGLPAFKA